MRRWTRDYLQALKQLADQTNPLLISDHLCRSGSASLSSNSQDIT